MQTVCDERLKELAGAEWRKLLAKRHLEPPAFATAADRLSFRLARGLTAVLAVGLLG
jgi:hypothetical protein